MKPLGLALVCVALLAGACSPSAPDQPTFEVDVKPILVAHCMRCHGTGQIDPSVTPSLRIMAAQFAFDQYATASALAAGILPYVQGMFDGFLMPPPPADRLTDYELDVLVRWAAETPPKP